ncbi:MAG: hypothetical protein LBT64_02935 [Puniceicoccales bacterium]|jgi:hypothetical protein|nr:hypothetical protein [Puniceicoccales bacterium]
MIQEFTCNNLKINSIAGMERVTTNGIDIGKLPIEITKIGERGEVAMNIGGFPAMIAEPKPFLLGRGYVVVSSRDPKKMNWQNALKCTVPGIGDIRGATNDSRLVSIGKMVHDGSSHDLPLGAFPSAQRAKKI